jgi:hypothetical protein
MLLESSALCLLENGIVCEEWEECEKREGEADGGPSFKMWKWKWQAWQGSHQQCTDQPTHFVAMRLSPFGEGTVLAHGFRRRMSHPTSPSLISIQTTACGRRQLVFDASLYLCSIQAECRSCGPAPKMVFTHIVQPRASWCPIMPKC